MEMAASLPQKAHSSCAHLNGRSSATSRPIICEEFGKKRLSHSRIAGPSDTRNFGVRHENEKPVEQLRGKILCRFQWTINANAKVLEFRQIETYQQIEALQMICKESSENESV
jgi:hypothetical protein